MIFKESSEKVFIKKSPTTNELLKNTRMYLKRIALSIVGIAIALALTAQSVYDISYSTYNCPDNLPYQILKNKYCPYGKLWDEHGNNYPITPPKSKLFEDEYTDAIRPHFETRDSMYYKIVSNLKREDVIICDPFELWFIEERERPMVSNFSIPITDWNITHKKKDRFKDFIIKDFRVRDVIVVRRAGDGIIFFIKKNSEEVTCYYYESLIAFVEHNHGDALKYMKYIGQEVRYEKMTKYDTKPIELWLKSIPMKTANQGSGDGAVNYIMKLAGDKKVYSVDLSLSLFE